ncbi:hypothetical protein GPA10_22385 [Streptomyces sp. p1417]|uniref:Uncharacterized protein n=1 Tax=Streptomyces typhae TaxID=2681492 RepID=A0A6L6X0X5_9ACTN|nr:hypothetical protein [Streptomyces typhae]MVO87434.1 hypothetical protein [Streptomyces typhae]
MNTPTHNAFRLLHHVMAGEAKRVAEKASTADFEAWARNELDAMWSLQGVDVLTLCPPFQVDWADVHRRFQEA